MEDIQQILQQNALLKAQLQLKDEQLNLKDEQLNLKDEQLNLKDEQLVRKQERILYLERQLYGRRSEKRLPSIDEAQLSLFSSAEGQVTLAQETAALIPIAQEIRKESEGRRHRKLTENRRPQTYAIPDNIERRTQTVEPENVELSQMVKIGEDVEEYLEYTPGSFYVKRIVRPIYKEKRQDEETLQTRFYQASVQARILPGSYAGTSLLTQIILDKFESHIPEYRQCERFKTLGLTLPTSTVNRWVHALADKLYPLYYWQMQQVLGSDYIQIDETPIRITDVPGKSRKGYVWAVRSASGKAPPGSFFHYDKGSRSADVVIKLLRDYQGAVQSDGYAAYNLYEDKKGVLLLGCLAHVRRKFEEAARSGVPEAETALEYIRLVYELEANLKERNADDACIVAERKAKAYPILQVFEKWMVDAFANTTPKSLLGKAISYAFIMLPRIVRYVSRADYQPDNNLVENVIRPLALGRKNYLFAGNNQGAENLALYYTLIASCKDADVEPTEWFNDILPRIDQYQGEAIKELRKHPKLAVFPV